MSQSFGGSFGNVQDWLKSFHIPRNVETLEDIQSIWECGGKDCPPLCKWTTKMRTTKGGRGSHSSIFNQRKKVYFVFKSCNFDVSAVMIHYHETKPGKLYKLLSSKPSQS